MNAPPQNDRWEENLRASLGVAPAPDFTVWCERHRDAIATLESPAHSVAPGLLQTAPRARRAFLTARWIAVLVLILGGLLWFTYDRGTVAPSAFADDIAGVDAVKSLSWTSTYYARYYSEDGKRTWLRAERRLHIYSHPGQYRETMLDEKGEAFSVHISDERAGRTLVLDVKNKKAILKSLILQNDELGPFAWVADIIRKRTFTGGARVKSVSLKGQKEIDKMQANVVRAIIQNLERHTEVRYDFLFSAATKQLAGIWVPNPNEVDLEFETAADLISSAEDKWSKATPAAALEHEIIVNPRLDSSEFSLDPPAGYSFERLAKPTVTEVEMIAYLGAAARFNDGEFPDSPYSAFDSDKFNKASEKKSSDRTPVEQALIDIRDKIMMREIYRSPIKQFEEDHTLPDSFHYFGSGVKLGQADSIVLWYKPRNAKIYRAIYGDLSVKDVTAAELPLNMLR